MTAQADLFTGVMELPPSRAVGRESYHLLSMSDQAALGCDECVHIDYARLDRGMTARCRFLGRMVDIIQGTCSEVKVRA